MVETLHINLSIIFNTLMLFLAYIKEVGGMCSTFFFLAYLSFCKADKRPFGNHTPLLQFSSPNVRISRRRVYRGFLFFEKNRVVLVLLEMSNEKHRFSKMKIVQHQQQLQ